MTSTIGNLFWKFAERTASQLVSFVVSIVLARILNPSDYGSIAMVMIFVTLANVFVEGGFSSALIQKKDADKLDFSTVFYFSMVFSIFLYVVLFAAAPHISKFYGKGYEILTPVLRINWFSYGIFWLWHMGVSRTADDISDNEYYSSLYCNKETTGTNVLFSSS